MKLLMLTCLALCCIAAVHPLPFRSDRQSITTNTNITTPVLTLDANFLSNQAELHWSHPNLYAFEVKQVTATSTNQQMLRYEGNFKQFKHNFSRKMKFNGPTTFYVRALAEPEASPWSNGVSVVP